MEIPKEVDWQQLKNIADSQGLSAVVLDGLNTDGTNLTDTMPLQLKLEWIGEVLQGESVYAGQWEAARKMAKVLDNNYIRTYVLKGFVVSECYPKPNHRVSVDMDCFLVEEASSKVSGSKGFDAWELGNQLMEHAGYAVDRSFYKNSTIMLKGLTVENHQFMTAVRGSRRLKNFERILQSWILGDTDLQRFEGTCMCRPPVMVSALFLIEHAYAHFLHEGLTWRMVLDWVMFSKKHQKEIDWYALDALIDEFGFRKFFDVFNEIGQDAFGGESSRILETSGTSEQVRAGELKNSTSKNLENSKLSAGSQRSTFNSILKEKMLNDIWADLDLHEFHGVKGKMALAGNEIRAAWKYHYFSPDTMIGDLFNRVRGFLFERYPKL